MFGIVNWFGYLRNWADLGLKNPFCAIYECILRFVVYATLRSGTFGIRKSRYRPRSGIFSRPQSATHGVRVSGTDRGLQLFFPINVFCFRFEEIGPRGVRGSSEGSSQGLCKAY